MSLQPVGSVAHIAEWLVCFFPSRRRHTRCLSDWSSDVCSSDLSAVALAPAPRHVWWRTSGRRRKSYCRPSRSLACLPCREAEDRKSVVLGKSGDLGGRRIIKKKKRGIMFTVCASQCDTGRRLLT